MKKFLISLVSVVLVLSMVLGTTLFTASAAEQGTFQRVASGALGGLIQGLLGGINAIFPDGRHFVDKEDFDPNENFYAGTGILEGENTNGQWKLGHNEVSLVPPDWKEHTYYLGGFIAIENGFTNNVEGVYDDMMARIVAIEDGSGRGINVFATIDCIGITNADIKEIRKQLVELAGDKYEFASVNVFSTHAHSGIDTEGLWTNLFGKILKNIPLSLFRSKNLEQGTDPHFMEFLYKTVSNGMLTACDNMETGTMTYARKDIGEEYFDNKNRSSASALITDMVRLTFTPDDADSDPTMIVNIAGHPDVAGLPTEDNSGREVSGDYVYYIGEVLNEAGYNCMFFNGAIAGIYMNRGATNDAQDMEHRAEQSARYGREIGKIALALTMDLDEIKTGELKEILYNEEEINAEIAMAQKNGGEYSLWCEGWTKATEYGEVDPLLNVVIDHVYIPVTNPFIQLAGKLKLANYDVLVTGFKSYEICVEIGYMEFGDELQVVMMPGEIVQDLVVGGDSLTASGSYTGKDFKYPCITEMFKNEDIICFGLANDAIGYVVPDNDYSMAIVYDHYQELISLGKYAASSIMEGFEKIAEDVA